MATYIQDTVGRDAPETVPAPPPRTRKTGPATVAVPSDTGEMSPVSGYLLIMFGALDDLLDFVAGYFPGIASIISFIPTSGQFIVVALDPLMRKRLSGEIFQLLLKRGLLIFAVWAVESLPIVNLLPLQTGVAFVVGRMKMKQRSMKSVKSVVKGR